MSHYMYIAMGKTNSGMVHGFMTRKRVCECVRECENVAYVLLCVCV